MDMHNLPCQDVKQACQAQQIDLLMKHKVTHIDRKLQTISCKNAETNHTTVLHYDVLVFAQDAEPMIPQIDGIHSCSAVYSALRAQDLLDVQELLQLLHKKQQREYSHSNIVSWKDFDKEDWLEMIENLPPDTNKLIPANRISALKKNHAMYKNRTYESSKEQLSALVLGAGLVGALILIIHTVLLGMQFTQALVNMDIHVHLVDMQSQPMYSMHDEKESLDEACMRMFKNRLEFQSNKRVECHWKNTVKRMAQEYSDKITVELHDGTMFYVNFVLLACGYKNDTSIAKQALLPIYNEPYGGIMVNDKTMQCLGDDHIYAIGMYIYLCYMYIR